MLHKRHYSSFFVLKVNGVNVMQSTHTDVVQLIKCKYFYSLSLICFIYEIEKLILQNMILIVMLY